MVYLLDVNILIALGDPAHEHHRRVQTSFHAKPLDWATCPITENGFLRIVGNSAYLNVKGDPQRLCIYFRQMCAWPGHQFWPDDLTLRDAYRFPNLPSSRKLTDLYLLGLAASRNGKLATLDKRIEADLIKGGTSAYFLIP